jgi:hypothetical protein
MCISIISLPVVGAASLLEQAARRTLDLVQDVFDLLIVFLVQMTRA